MLSVTIIGTPISHYVQSVVLCCEEKGIAYSLVVKGHDTPSQLKMPAHRRYHPFGKIPVLLHNGNELYETSAICRYLDLLSATGNLVPAKAYEAALMEQWISVVSSYLHRPCISGLVSHYVFPRGGAGKPDHEAIALALSEVKEVLPKVDAALTKRPFLAGSALSLADLLLLPLLLQLRATPEWGQLSPLFPSLDRYAAFHLKRDSVRRAMKLLCTYLPPEQQLFRN